MHRRASVYQRAATTQAIGRIATALAAAAVFSGAVALASGPECPGAVGDVVAAEGVGALPLWPQWRSGVTVGTQVDPAYAGSYWRGTLRAELEGLRREASRGLLIDPARGTYHQGGFTPEEIGYLARRFGLPASDRHRVIRVYVDAVVARQADLVREASEIFLASAYARAGASRSSATDRILRASFFGLNPGLRFFPEGRPRRWILSDRPGGMDLRLLLPEQARRIVAVARASESPLAQEVIGDSHIEEISAVFRSAGFTEPEARIAIRGLRGQDPTAQLPAPSTTPEPGLSSFGSPPPSLLLYRERP